MLTPEYMLTPDQIADKVQILCRARGMSVSSVLKTCGLDKDLISRMKLGTEPQISRVAALASFFGISVSSLIGEPVPVSSDIESLISKYGYKDADRQALIEYLDHALAGLKAATPLLEQHHD